MTAAELVEWQAWDRVAGMIGTPREDFRHAAAAAAICQTIASALGSKAKIRNSDLIPFDCPWGSSSAQASGTYYLTDPRDQLALFAAMAGVEIPDGKEDRQSRGSSDGRPFGA